MEKFSAMASYDLHAHVVGEGEDSEVEAMFGQDALDPLALLEDMEREAGEAGDIGARQPYQVRAYLCCISQGVGERGRRGCMYVHMASAHVFV